MSAERRILVWGVAAVLVIATVGAAAARSFGFQYWMLSGISLAIYFSVGRVAAKSGAAVARATGLGAIVGLIDVTLGWALSAAIEPGRLEDSPFSRTLAIVLGALVALATFVFAAWLGALAGRRRRR
jgi:type IV secretory pathway TrbD component